VIAVASLTKPTIKLDVLYKQEKGNRLLRKKILILKLWPNTKLWNGKSALDIGVTNVISNSTLLNY
jgi:hypothetical protein